MSAESATIVAIKPQGRSRVSNGSALLASVDGRGREARRYRDVLDQLLAQLPHGPAESHLILARRAAALAVWCEGQEAAIARDEPIDVMAMVTATNALRRLLIDLGVAHSRRPAPAHENDARSRWWNEPMTGELNDNWTPSNPAITAQAA